MRKIKYFSLLTALILIVTGVCGCMFKPGVTNRLENDQEYVNMMLEYIESKYDKEFDVVEYTLPEEGFNSGQLENSLIVRERETGVVTDVYSYLSAPYQYYDNYVSDLASYQCKSSVSLDSISSLASAKLYIYLRNEDIDNIDVSRDNVSRAVLVVNINGKPDDENLSDLYEAYSELFLLDYEYKYMIVGFTEPADVFESYVASYRVYGVKDWQDYDAKVYATFDAKESGLSLEEFKALCDRK